MGDLLLLLLLARVAVENLIIVIINITGFQLRLSSWSRNLYKSTLSWGAVGKENKQKKMKKFGQEEKEEEAATPLQVL